MEQKIHLSRNLQLPASIMTGKLAILGRTGSGKTNTAVVMAEQMIAAGLPVAILDPQGDWWGLRSKFKIAILGGEHADVPLEPTGGAIAADFVINERVPVLLDLFTMGESDMVRFATDFARRLWQANRHALHVFLDEADLFAPQRDLKGPKAACLGAWQNVCRRGRSRGLGLTMITQRSAVLNKDLLTQADPLFVHRLTAPQDLDAVDRYLEFHGIAKPQRLELLKQVAGLPVGECLVLSTGELQIAPRVVQVRKRESHDSSATPQAGQRSQGPKSLAEVDLSALEKAMAETIERAKESDPKQLRQRVKELEKQLAAASSGRPVADPAMIERAVAAAEAKRDAHWQQRLKRFAVLEKDLNRSIELASNVRDWLQSDWRTEKPVDAQVLTAKAPPARRPAAVCSPVIRTGEQPNLTKAERAILIALYWVKDDQQTTPAKVGFYSGYSSGSGSFNNAMSTLRNQHGLVTGWQLTPAGEALAASLAEAKPSGAELREWLRPKLSKAENEILDVLIAAGGTKLISSDIADRTASGYSAGSGSFNNAMSTLRKLEAAIGFDRDGGTAAHPVFFE